jgi:hypothetical protein
MEIDREKERAIAKLQALIDQQSKIDGPEDFAFSAPQYHVQTD